MRNGQMCVLCDTTNSRLFLAQKLTTGYNGRSCYVDISKTILSDDDLESAKIRDIDVDDCEHDTKYIRRRYCIVYILTIAEQMEVVRTDKSRFDDYVEHLISISCSNNIKKKKSAITESVKSLEDKIDVLELRVSRLYNDRDELLRSLQNISDKEEFFMNRFIVGRHVEEVIDQNSTKWVFPSGGLSYIWRVPISLYDSIHVNDYVVVETSHGEKTVVVDDIVDRPCTFESIYNNSKPVLRLYCRNGSH